MEENTFTNRSVHARRFYLFEDQDYLPKYLGHDKEGPCHGLRVDEASDAGVLDDHGVSMYYVKGRTLSRTIFGFSVGREVEFNLSANQLREIEPPR